MGCKACFAANSTAIGKKSNAADRPSPYCHPPRGVMKGIPHASPEEPDLRPHNFMKPIWIVDDDQSIRFVLEKAEGYSLDDSDIAFITAFYSNGIVGSTIKWIERGSMISRLPENITANGVGLSKSQYNRDIVKRIGDSFDATIYDMIECCL